MRMSTIRLSLVDLHRNGLRVGGFIPLPISAIGSADCQRASPYTVSNCPMATDAKPSLNIDTLNPNVKLMEYAIRGPLLSRAGDIEQELANGVKKNFTELIKANIGDCHAMGQKPITFIRQVLALVAYPELLKDDKFPKDAKERADKILEACRGRSVGAYTDSPGIPYIRKHVAEYLKKRDGGIPADWHNIILCAGASTGINNLMRMFRCTVNGKPPGVMIPIPQYPLYSATIAEQNMEQIGYYLNESEQWALDVSELEKSVKKARDTCNPRAIVIINPGNPTGQVFTRENIQQLVKFAHKERLFILADEVYQDNIYSGSQFHSTKKVMMEMGDPFTKMELASFMSCSKGYMGECGLRGGFVEIVNMCPEVKPMYLKSISARLCSNAFGQTCTGVIVNPPIQGEPSYNQFMSEKKAVFESLQARAKMVVDTFNSFEGFKCNNVQGAMYAFPQVKLPPKAIAAANKANLAPDAFYVAELLEHAGVCVVPGSGFGQRPGTYHFRTTILPQPKKLKVMLKLFQQFHQDFVKQYK